MVTGAKRNYSPGKLAKALNSAFIDAFKPMIRELNVQIQDTINTSTDIDGKPFAKLKKSTTSIRKKRGQPAQPPLKISGKMRKTKIKIATKTNLLFEIEMTGKSKKGVYYGSLHNKGFPSKGMISEKTVPARKWFGIPKNYKKGGARYEEARRAVRHNIKTSFDTVMRKII